MIAWLVAIAYTLVLVTLGTALHLREDPRVRRRLGRADPPSGSGAFERIGARIRAPRARARLAARLGAEINSPDLDRLMGLKALLSGLGLLLGAGAIGDGPAVAAGATAVLALGGYRLPDFLLARSRERMRRTLDVEVSDLVDLVSVAIAAGLTPRLALERASRTIRGPLRSELASVRERVSLGTPWTRALEGAAGSRDLPTLARLARTLSRAERFGTPAGVAVRRLASDVRADRWAAGEERARRAPVVLLFPLVFLILPAFILAAVVPALLVATRGLT